MPDNNIKGWIKLVDKAMSNTDHKIHTHKLSIPGTKKREIVTDPRDINKIGTLYDKI